MSGGAVIAAGHKLFLNLLNKQPVSERASAPPSTPLQHRLSTPQCAVSTQPPAIITHMLSMGGPGQPGPIFASPFLHRQSPLSEGTVATQGHTARTSRGGKRGTPGWVGEARARWIGAAQRGDAAHDGGLSVRRRFPWTPHRNCLCTPALQWQPRGTTANLTGVCAHGKRPGQAQLADAGPLLPRLQVPDQHPLRDDQLPPDRRDAGVRRRHRAHRGAARGPLAEGMAAAGERRGGARASEPHGIAPIPAPPSSPGNNLCIHCVAIVVGCWCCHRPPDINPRMFCAALTGSVGCRHRRRATWRRTWATSPRPSSRC